MKPAKREGRTIAARGLVSAAETTGHHSTTARRFIKKGWLKAVNVSGRFYCTPSQQDEFIRRAENGEFAKGPHGACKAAPEGGAL